MKDIDPIIMTLLREDELDAIKDGENVMVVGGFTRNTGSMAMAKRTNMCMVMVATGKEFSEVLDNKGHLGSIRDYGFTFVSLKRMIAGKDRYEVVMLLLARNHEKMKIIRDYILEIKDSNASTWSYISQHGVKYHYTPTIEEASLLTGIPDTYRVRCLAIYNLNDDTSAVEILDKVEKYAQGNILNIQVEEQRNKSNELFLDDHQRPKRAYVFLGNAKVEINEHIISSLSVIMRHGTKYEKQIHVLTMLPFWTTTYFFYLTEKNEPTEEADKDKSTRQKTSETVKPKVSVHQEQRKLNDIRYNE